MRFLFALCLLAGAASAATIYKCTADGKVSYSQTPCATGAASAVLEVPAAPAPDPAAGAELQRQKSEAEALQKARKKREAKEEREAAKSAAAAAAHRKKCARLALEKKWADDEARGATTGATSGGTVSAAPAARARTKASHAADLLALECPE